MLFQWLDLIQRLLESGQMPICEQVVPVNVSPLQNSSQGALGKLSLNYSCLDFDGNLVITIFRVKMRWFMVSIEHADHDSEKTAYLRHLIVLSDRFPGGFKRSG